MPSIKEARKLRCPLRQLGQRNLDGRGTMPGVLTSALCEADGCAWWEATSESGGLCVVMNLRHLVETGTGGRHD